MVELALLRAGIPLEVLKVISEEDAWLYYFVLRKQEEISNAQMEATTARMRSG